jgi:hypothetical protein
MFLQSVSWLSIDYMAFYPRNSNVRKSLGCAIFLLSYVKLCSILYKLVIEACSELAEEVLCVLIVVIWYIVYIFLQIVYVKF